MEGLTFVDGQSKEDIEEKLRNAGIEFNSLDAKKNSPYFRRTMINIRTGYGFNVIKEKLNSRDLIEILGYPEYFRSGSFYYYARYKMEDDFDVSLLDGKLTFKNGFLVESTLVNY